MPAPDLDAWWSPFKELDDSTVFHVDLTPHAAREASAFSWLDAAERQRWRRFHYPGPRRRFALCRAALRSILCDRLECPNRALSFGESRYGKPFAMIDDAPVPASFNVSHSGRHGLIGFARRGRLGVDVEEIVHRDDDYVASVGAWAFTPSERDALASTRGRQKMELFFKLWTIKEALMKAVGMGLSFDTSGLDVLLQLRAGTSGALQLQREPWGRWRIDYLGNQTFAAAIVHEAITRPGLGDAAASPQRPPDAEL